MMALSVDSAGSMAVFRGRVSREWGCSLCWVSVSVVGCWWSEIAVAGGSGGESGSGMFSAMTMGDDVVRSGQQQEIQPTGIEK